jgi:hypothetical protein
MAEPKALHGRENKVEKSGVLFDHEKRLLAVHVYHAIHHNLTTKTPRSAATFL